MDAGDTELRVSYPVKRLSAPNPWLFESRPNRGTELVGVMIHSTRSGRSDGDDGPRTVRWMGNPNNGSQAQGWGSSCDEVIAEDGTRTLITPDYKVQAPTYGAGYGGAGTWSAGWYYYQFEVAQGRPEDAYTDAEIESLAERVRELAKEHGFGLGRIIYLHQTGEPPEGICTHEGSANGKKLGKSDPGGRFPWDKFMGLLKEEDMLTDEDKSWIVSKLRSEVVAAIGRVDQHTDARETKTQEKLDAIIAKLDTMPTLEVTADEIVDKIKERL